MHYWLSQPAFCERRWSPERQDQHSILIPPEAEGYFTFASVRNPFDRAVSLWAHSQSGSSFQADNTYPMAFDEFVLDYQPRATWFYRLSQSELLAPVRLDAVVRFDHLEEDLHQLPPITAAAQAGAVLEPLPQFNETSHPPWQEICTPELVARLVYLWFGDFELYGIDPQAQTSRKETWISD